MILQIEIPKEFEQDFKSDKFKEFFVRSLGDMHYLCGRYERETADMFIKAFANSTVLKKSTEDIVKELDELRRAEIDYSDDESELMDVDSIYEEGKSSGRCEAYYNAIQIVKGCTIYE